MAAELDEARTAEGSPKDRKTHAEGEYSAKSNNRALFEIIVRKKTINTRVLRYQIKR